MATEKRLIDANALKIHRMYNTGANHPLDVAYRKDIDNAQTVEAVEVVHGRWVDEFDGKYANPKYICSHCTLKALYKQKLDALGNWQTVQALTDYCPHCGAKMDGDGNGT